ncbi:hypothetical protein [Pseudarthrobacter sulfonivorans]|uniref:hypothetical protein n=1 Tax=Pseudarthrobacter sulfonivorans TaxID=121292 RepID=UPI002865E1D0|nr:hypothetical protein [Pseudarthrobacter sulfonivorans]MDR6415235.1 hypothetical protein [Pseudarthrobacter sulfonivorans]
MMDADEAELKRQMARQVPHLRELGARTLETYAKAGILEAIPDDSWPVADALFKRRDNSFTYHPHGAVYLNITRKGELQLALPDGAVPLHDGMIQYMELAREADLDSGPAEGATEWFPPPRFVLVAETSRLYIESAALSGSSGITAGLVPLEQYVEERAQLFVEGFQAAL